MLHMAAPFMRGGKDRSISSTPGSWLLKKIPSNTYYFIIGLVAASIFQVVMASLESLNASFLSVSLSIAALAAGFGIAFGFSRIKRKRPGQV